MLDENNLILAAIGMPSPKKKPRRVMKEIYPSDLCEEEDAIWKISKKEAKSKKKPTIQKWSNMDFVKYIHETLSVQGLRLESRSLRDAEQIAALYDKFVAHIPDRMNNNVLKEYIEWWVNTQAPHTRGDHIFVQTLSNNKCIEKFVSRLRDETDDSPKQAQKAETEIDAHALYKMGGIIPVLTSKGIVIACATLKELGSLDYIKISDALKSLPKEVLERTFEITLQRAPYSADKIVDFVSLSHKSFAFHELKKFGKINYKEYFKSNDK